MFLSKTSSDPFPNLIVSLEDNSGKNCTLVNCVRICIYVVELASSERTQADMVGMGRVAVELLRMDPSNCAETRTRIQIRTNE